MSEIYENLDLKDFEGEIWKDIEDYNGDYQVSNLGRVKSLKFGKERILKYCKHVGDYFCTYLYKNGNSECKRINILVYETFNDYNLKNNEVVHHIDENIKNNYINNLKKLSLSNHIKIHMVGKTKSIEHRNKISNTKKEKIKIGEIKILKGENIKNNILISQDVIQIKLLLKEGKLTQQEIDDIFKIKQARVSEIKLEKSWSNIKI